MRYGIPGYEYLLSVLAGVNDDPSLPWNCYPCIEWIRSTSNTGYGMVRRDRKSFAIHRLSWELSNGPIPDGLMVLHRCDNRRCFRPKHLFVGTALDNVHDMMSKSRQRHPGWRKGLPDKLKITTDQAMMICELYSSGISQPTLATRFGINRMTVCRIVKRRRNDQSIYDGSLSSRGASEAPRIPECSQA